MLTIYEICKEWRVTTNGKAFKGSLSVVDGLVPAPPPAKEGYMQFTPEQAAGVIVERITFNEGVKGYQRISVSQRKARSVARDLKKGKKISILDLAIDGGKVFAVDGAHRLCGSVISRCPVPVVVRAMTPDQRAEVFANQRLATRPSTDNIVLAGSGLINEYIKAAINARNRGEDHPWAALIGNSATDLTISPNVAYEVMGRYCLDLIGGSGTIMKNIGDEALKRFRKADADELASLLLCCGTKQTNPLAFRPAAVKALADLAVLALVRRGKRGEDIQRWRRHTPSFDWAGYAYLTHTIDIRDKLVQHWNKRLSTDRKIRASEADA